MLNLKLTELFTKCQFGQFHRQIEIADDLDETLQVS